MTFPLAGSTDIPKAISSAATRCVDIVCIGDSNQLKDGTGWDHGLARALGQRFNMYGTGILSCRENNGAGAGTGYLFSRISTPSDGAASSGAPATLNDYLDKGSGGLFPADYFYFASGSFNSQSNGMLVNGPCPLDVNANLRYEVDHGTFDSGSPTIRMYARQEVSPFTTIVDQGSQTTNTGEVGISTRTLEVPAGARDYNVGFRWVRNGTSITGPVFCLWQTVINRDRSSGFRLSTLNARGSESFRTQANDLQQLSDTSLDYYFKRVRDRQVELGQKPIVVFCQNGGLNDRNETQPSLGPNPVSDGDSPEALVDNLNGIRERIISSWERQGWDLSELYFWTLPSHPVSTPNDTELTAYEEAINNMVTLQGSSSTTVISQTLPQQEYMDDERAYYINQTTETEHLVENGYEGVSQSILCATLGGSAYSDTQPINRQISVIRTITEKISSRKIRLSSPTSPLSSLFLGNTFIANVISMSIDGIAFLDSDLPEDLIVPTVVKIVRKN